MSLELCVCPFDIWILDGEMYEWMGVWKIFSSMWCVCVCVDGFGYGFADVLQNMSAGLPNLCDTARHSPSSRCCLRTCCWASHWLESSASRQGYHHSKHKQKQQAINNHQQPHQERHCQHPFHPNNDHQCNRKVQVSATFCNLDSNSSRACVSFRKYRS